MIQMSLILRNQKLVALKKNNYILGFILGLTICRLIDCVEFDMTLIGLVGCTRFDG